MILAGLEPTLLDSQSNTLPFELQDLVKFTPKKIRTFNQLVNS